MQSNHIHGTKGIHAIPTRWELILSVLFFLNLACFAKVFADESHSGIIEPTDSDVRWTQLHQGISFSENSSTTPRLQKVYVLRIDLNEKGLSFFTTPRRQEGFEMEKNETVRRRTGEFLEQYQLLVAVNANFFSLPKGESFDEPGSSDLHGIAVSAGTVVSKPKAGYKAFFALKKDGTPIIGDDLKSDAELDEFEIAVAGNVVLLDQGNIVQRSDQAVHPRSAVGISQDRRFVYLLVVDGRRKEHSIGANYAETAAWLRFYGAWDGLNLDGGGSTTMAVRDEQGRPKIVNRPSGRLRYNGNNLGVRSLTKTSSNE